MPNPLSSIVPVLDFLGKGIKVLPSTGGAVEDLQRPDADELDDSIINAEVRDIDTFAEEPTPDSKNLYKPTPPCGRSKGNVYRFFIDGSIRVYFIGTGIERNRTFPIELAQIGSACLKRLNDGSITAHATKNRIVLLVPKGGEGVSDSLWEELLKLTKNINDFQVIDTTQIHGGREIDLRTRAGGVARDRMHHLEVEIIDATNGFRNDNNWVILDGAVKFGGFIQTDHLIGVAKSFDKKPQFYFGPKKAKPIDVTGLIAGLPYAHRTAAFSAHNGDVAFWYVRLWEQIHLDYPLMGVVKVEFPRPNKELVPSDLIDVLSCALVAERSVTPYGQDRRWHCHLYPIFCAEQVIKNKFYSKEVLLGAIRWPKQNTMTI